MIAGLGGGLVSHAYVEQHLLSRAAGGDLERFERRLGRWWRHVSRTLGPASSARSVLDVAALPLLQMLDHGVPTMRAHALGLAGTIAESGAGLVCLPWSTPARLAWREAARCGIDIGAAWALVCNGKSLSVIDCSRPWSRAGIEFVFETLLANPKGVAALWLLVNAAAIGGRGPDSLRARVTESDAHAARVCGALGDGVLAALPRLAEALDRGHAATRAAGFDQALTVVYRILFLLFAEARGLVPVWHELYRGAYTIESLTRRASTGHAAGLWSAIQAISRLAHAGCQAGGIEVTAFNGRLFSPRHAPLVEQRRVPDATVRDVLLSLATETTRLGRRRISYYDLGVEELGAVYERVLEYEPRPRGPSLVLTRTSAERKATGSFYTPRSIAGFLVRRTLAPLVEGRTADQILSLRILDPAMGSGAFLVAACRYLADHCELALIRDGRWSAPEVSTADRAGLRRQIAERCLYGVDLNPTAVQLARLSLWLTTLAAARPLTFLDHHLATGNSLLGARLGDLSRPPRTRSAAPAPLPLFDDELADAVSARVLPQRLRLALTPSDSLDAVKDKERWLAALLAADGPLAQWSAAADAWCAAALWPGAAPAAGLVAEWIAAATHAPTTLPAARLQASLAQARELAARHGAFHWEIVFPEVFFDHSGRPAAGGGFDAVIGNPPWDMLRADLGSAAARSDAREATAAVLRFFRASRIYLHQGQGHANRYQLFLERALQLTRDGGRVGLILPSGIATDHGSAALRRHLFDRTTIDTWLGFDNRRRIFPIHRSMRFVLLATTRSGRTEHLSYRCGLDDASALEGGDGRAPALLTVARARLEAWSPDLAVPEIPDATALALLTTIASRVPALAGEAGWGVRFGRELNATDDRPHFVALGAPRRHGLLPIVEGKQLAPFQVALDRSASGISRRVAAKLLDAAATFTRARIGYRDVAGATNKLTLIAAMLPAGTVSTHTVFCAKTLLDDKSQWCLLGLLNSLVANYLVRRQVTTHVTTALMARLPVPRPAKESPAFKQLASLARAISVVGIEVAVDDYAALNAIAADLYGVSSDQYRYILGTFPLLSEDLRRRCLAAFQTHPLSTVSRRAVRAFRSGSKC